MQNNYFKISISLTKEENVYYADCAELPGCHSQGDNYEEVKKNIQEAVDLYLESFTEHEAIECLGKTPVQAAAPTFEVPLMLIAGQAEKLLLNAGFSLTASKDNHRLYLKKNQRIILPLLPGKKLSQKTVKEVLDLVEA